MKKFISFVLGATLAFTLIGFSFSDSVLDYLDDIGGDILFGYNTDNKISVDNITSTSVSIKSPVLKDDFLSLITSYTLMYSEHKLSDLLDDPTLLNDSKEKSFNNLDLSSKDDFTMDLDESDDSLISDKIYYVSVVPKDDSGGMGEISNELCFRLSDKISGEGDDCKDMEGSNAHGAGADMSLANISHTIDGDTVTLRWLSINGSDNIEIFLRDEDEGTFHKLSTVSMSDESYSFDISNGGEHIVKFIPDDGGTEINYTFNKLNIVKKDVVSKVTPVVVGPKENIIAILIGTLLIYLVYRVARRKS